MKKKNISKLNKTNKIIIFIKIFIKIFYISLLKFLIFQIIFNFWIIETYWFQNYLIIQ